MRHLCIGLLALAALVAAAPAHAQAQLGCRHSGPETRASRESREEALAAVRLINNLLARGRDTAPYPSWEALANSPQLPAMRSDGGALGELARKIAWGTMFPLPNWRVHYVASVDAYAVSLTDTADPCLFTYYSNDTGVIVEGEPIGQRRGRLLPLSE